MLLTTTLRHTLPIKERYGIHGNDNLILKVAPEDKLDTGRACGEPLKTQHLAINFTPGKDDSIEVQQKVQKFWNLVDHSPELGKFLEPPFKPDDSTTATSKASRKSLESLKSNHSNTTKTSKEYPAVHLLRTLDKKGNTNYLVDLSCVTVNSLSRDNSSLIRPISVLNPLNALGQSEIWAKILYAGNALYAVP